MLFDGTCAFCEGSVRFIATRDRTGYFRFGASQSPQAIEILKRHGVDRESARSIILIEDGQVYLRSTATLRIARHLGFPWKLAAALLWIPVPFATPFTAWSPRCATASPADRTRARSRRLKFDRA